MNKKSVKTPKDLRKSVTKNIISDMLVTPEPAVVKEAAAPEIIKDVANQKPVEPKAQRSLEAQNSRISWMNDITNAARSLKGLGKSVPNDWMSRSSLANKTNAELWALRGEATRAATAANAAKKPEKVSPKAPAKDSAPAAKTTLEASTSKLMKLTNSSQLKSGNILVVKIQGINAKIEIAEVFSEADAKSADVSISGTVISGAKALRQLIDNDELSDGDWLADFELGTWEDIREEGGFYIKDDVANSNKETKTASEAGKIRIKGAKPVEEADAPKKGPRAIPVTSFEQSKKYCMGTRWCLNNEKMFNAYISKGKLILLTGNGRKVMIHVPDGLFYPVILDEQDTHISLDEALELTGVSKEQFEAAKSGSANEALKDKNFKKARVATEAVRLNPDYMDYHEDFISDDGGTINVHGYRGKVQEDDTVSMRLFVENKSFVTIYGVAKDVVKTGSGRDFMIEVDDIVSESLKKKGKVVKESQIQKPVEGDTSLSICPLCGSSQFNAQTENCPVCAESYKKYRVVEAADFDLDEYDEYTTIDMDGEEKVLLDEEGNTSVVNPHELEGKLQEHTHDLVLEGQDEPLPIDSGFASDHDEPDGDEDEFGNEPEMMDNPDAEEDSTAFIKLPIGVEECLDMLQEENEDAIEVVPTDDGYEVIISMESAEPEAEDVEDESEVNEVPEEEEEVEAASEAEEIDEFEFDEELEEPETDADGDQVVLFLREMAKGTIMHVEGITTVESLIEIINQLLPETAEIVEALPEEEEEEVIKEDVAQLEDDQIDDEILMEDEEQIQAPQEAAKPKLSSFLKDKKNRIRTKKMAQAKAAKGRKVVEHGIIHATMSGKPIAVQVKAVYEAKLPKITKADPKVKGKVKAAGAPSAKSLASTMEAAKTQREFMKVGMEALGSALNTRKLLLSLWDAIKENKPGSSKSLLNTLESALKDAPKKKAKAKKEAPKKITKLENKKVKKVDKVVRFGGK